jgi:phytoene dehydrogenase-like protein
MAQSYDAIIIGGGHNGLVTAAYLAKGGHKVLVLERRNTLGGVASTEESFSGFKFDSVAHGVGTLSAAVVRDLDLNRHGLDIIRPNPAVFSPLPDGNHLTLWQDMAQTVEAIAKFSKKDVERWPAFVALVQRMAAILESVENLTMPHMPTPAASELLAFAGLGRQVQKMSGSDRPEFLRFIPMSVYELANDWFESDALKGVLGAVGITGLLQ